MTLRTRILSVLAILIAALCLTPSHAEAQSIAARFQISAVKDTTIEFAIGDARWIKVGLQGRAVDPARNDEMIAQFRVLQITGTTAEAVITGQTRRVIDAHVAVLQQPSRPFWRQATFWIGSLAGVIVGAVAGAAL